MSSIPSLARMEQQLYGGFGMNSSAPSYLNNYQGTSQWLSNYNPSFYGYNQTDSMLNNQRGLYDLPSDTTTFGQAIPNNISSSSSAGENTNFQGLTKEQEKAITDYYAKNLEPSESLKGAIVSGGVMGAFMMNPRTILHPWNTITTAFKGDTVEMFKDLRKFSRRLFFGGH